MNNAGIVDRVDCVCKLNRMPSETQNPLHALLGTRLCVDSDECCVPIVDTIVPDNTLLGGVKISLHTPSSTSALNDRELDIVPIKQSSAKSRMKTIKPFTCGFLRKKNSDKHGTDKSVSSVSSGCICKTHKWKFPMIVQKAWKHNRRVRLKSNPSFNNMPLQRYQSHHSSSDEDWFEEIADDEINNLDERKTKTLTNADDLPINFESESGHVSTNRFKWYSHALRKFCDKRPLTETKISDGDPTNSCRIL